MQLMIHELSILIPAYNSDCRKMVDKLRTMCEGIAAPFSYEILVADDASTDRTTTEANRQIEQWEGCRLLVNAVNKGSAATRNLLATHSQYEWLLFLDSDMEIPSQHFILNYLSYEDYDVVNGGIAIGGDEQQWHNNLRYQYEKKSENKHTAARRNESGFRQFRSTNFMIRRSCFMACPFDERFKKSGYEDVHFGRKLERNGATIMHIDNPLVLADFEDNAGYIVKCERNMRTLFQFRSEMEGFSDIMQLAERLPHTPIKIWHRLFGGLERRLLTGQCTSLTLFNIYRIGYIVSLF